MEEIKLGKYRHFKGKDYMVIGLGKDSETEEMMVIYRALYGDGDVWVRPLKMWNETVERNGETFRRFSYIPEEDVLRIAVAYDEEGGEVYYHFGHCPMFKIYEVREGDIVHEEYLDTSGGHGCELIDRLLQKEVKVLITDGMGPHPDEYAKSFGMVVIAGAKGKADDVVRDYLRGSLRNDPSAVKPCGECEH